MKFRGNSIGVNAARIFENRDWLANQRLQPTAAGAIMSRCG
jgi:hypothetical protein